MTRAGLSRRSLGIAAAACVVLTLAFAVPEYILRQVIGQPAGWGRVLAGVAPHFLLWALFAALIALVVRRLPIGRPLVVTVAIYLVLGLLLYALDGAISFVVLPHIITDRELTRDVLGALFIRTFYDDFLLYWSIVAALHLVRYERRLASEQRARVELEREFSTAQLNALKAQLQPHFLFNTLNAASELLHTDPRAAERVLAHLSELMRSTLALGDRQELALRDELAMLEQYLSIQQVRFGDSIVVERDIDDAALGCAVPALVLQPLVENAFRHAFSRRRRDGRLTIRARAGETLQLEVRDNGTGLEPRWREGIGLSNTRARLERLYGDAQRMTITSAEGGGTVTSIDLPRRSL